MNPVLRLLLFAALFCIITGTTYADISTLALTGQVAPGVGNAQFSSIGNSSINSSGEIAFHAGLSNGGEGIFKVSQRQPSLIALKGRSISGSPQLTIGAMGDPVINDSGAIAFFAQLQGGQAQLQAVLVSSETEIQMLLDSTTPIPGSSQTITLIRDIHFNNRGDLAVKVDLSSPTESSIFIIPAVGPPQLIRNTGSFSLNNAGDIAFVGGDGNIYLFSGGMTQLVAQSGQPIPNTSLTLNTMDSPCLNDEGVVVFVNGIVNALKFYYFAPNSIVKWRNGLLEKVAAVNDTVSGLGTATLSAYFNSPLINNSGKVFFISRLSAGSTQGIFSAESGGLTLLVQEGQTLEEVGRLNFIGKPAVNDSGTLIFVSRLDSGSSGLFRLYTSMNETYFPRVADGSFGNQWAWRTALIISNREGSASANVTVNFFKEDGSPMSLGIQNLNGSQFSFVIPALGSLQLETKGAGEVQTGWARIQSNRRLSGIAIFSYYDGSGNYISEVGAPATSSLNAFSLFVESRTDTNTAIVLANPNASPTSATLTLRDTQGNSVDLPIDLLVPANGEIAKYVTDLFQGIVAPDFHGTIDVVSALPIVGLNLRQRKDVFTWLPVTQ